MATSCRRGCTLSLDLASCRGGNPSSPFSLACHHTSSAARSSLSHGPAVSKPKEAAIDSQIFADVANYSLDYAQRLARGGKSYNAADLLRRLKVRGRWLVRARGWPAPGCPAPGTVCLRGKKKAGLLGGMVVEIGRACEMAGRRFGHLLCTCGPERVAGVATPLCSCCPALPCHCRRGTCRTQMRRR